MESEKQKAPESRSTLGFWSWSERKYQASGDDDRMASRWWDGLAGRIKIINFKNKIKIKSHVGQGWGRPELGEQTDQNNVGRGEQRWREKEKIIILIISLAI